MALAASSDPGQRQAASAVYSWDPERQTHLPFALDVLTLEGDRIKDITAFVTRSIEGRDRDFYARWPLQDNDPARVAVYFERFGLPDHVD